jgi:hypothetical protein
MEKLLINFPVYSENDIWKRKATFIFATIKEDAPLDIVTVNSLYYIGSQWLTVAPPPPHTHTH